jgi:hypothetical protein
MPTEVAEVALKKVYQFNDNLSQHYLFCPRPNEVLLLHGLTFKDVNVSDFIFRISKK